MGASWRILLNVLWPVLSQSTPIPAQSQVAQGSCPTGKPGEKEASSVAAAANLAAAISITCRQITSVISYHSDLHNATTQKRAVLPAECCLGLMSNYLAFDRISQRAAACRNVCSFPGSVAWRCPAWQDSIYSMHPVSSSQSASMHSQERRMPNDECLAPPYPLVAGEIKPAKLPDLKCQAIQKPCSFRWLDSPFNVHLTTLT